MGAPAVAADATKLPFANDRFDSLFRYTTGNEGWEVPCGGVAKDEAPLTAARRELQEETGFTSESWEELGTFDSMNGISNSVSYVFVAHDLKQTGKNELVEEGITDIRGFTFDETFGLVRDGAIVDGLSIAALMKLLSINGPASMT